MQVAVDTLTSAYNIAKYQIDYSTAKKPTMRTSSISSYFTSLVSPNTTGLPLNPPSSEIHTGSDGKSLSPTFIPNGVLRANVIRAECCLLIGMLQMTQESVVGYLKCGLNLKKGKER
jgi:hypothetical protein